MHDFKLAHPFPNTGPNVEAYQQLQEQGIRWPGTAASIRVSKGFILIAA